MNIQWLSPAIPALASLLLALLSGVWLFNTSFQGELTNTIISAGLDPLRAALIAAYRLLREWQAKHQAMLPRKANALGGIERSVTGELL